MRTVKSDKMLDVNRPSNNNSSKPITTTEGDDEESQCTPSSNHVISNKPGWGTQVTNNNLGFMNGEGSQLAKGLPKPKPTQSFLERKNL